MIGWFKLEKSVAFFYVLTNYCLPCSIQSIRRFGLIYINYNVSMFVCYSFKMFGSISGNIYFLWGWKFIFFKNSLEQWNTFENKLVRRESTFNLLTNSNNVINFCRKIDIKNCWITAKLVVSHLYFNLK